MPENVPGNSPGSSPENAKQAWTDVGERFSSLGRRLSGHYREAGGAGRATVEGSQRKLEEAAREIGNEIGRAFSALGETISDDDGPEARGQRDRRCGHRHRQRGREGSAEPGRCRRAAAAAGP